MRIENIFSDYIFNIDSEYMIQSILVIAFILLAFEIIFIMNEFKNKDLHVTVIQQYVYNFLS